jgi:hypothetical protein
VNGKRTDLSEVLLNKARGITKARAIKTPQIFQGHTRFATSSIANLEGTHPHQWTPRVRCLHWFDDSDRWKVSSRRTTVEAYITHNGDLDFFELHGVTYPLSDVQQVRTSSKKGHVRTPEEQPTAADARARTPRAPRCTDLDQFAAQPDASNGGLDVRGRPT